MNFAGDRVQLVDAVELAGILSVSRSLVFDLANQGVIPCHRLGRSIRFDVAELLIATRRT